MSTPNQTQLIDAWDVHVHAFVTICDAPSGRQVSDARAPLADLTVGVKDIIDVAGLPTRNGSSACRNAASAAKDAQVVAALRSAGAKIIGKTTTTEFAFTDPTNCRNPYDLHRTPGGSSSGSGAAVAAGLVDIALGTQTAGSLIRPAAYCGAVGFKPTYGLLSTAGVTPLAPSFDTVGLITGSVDDAMISFVAMTDVDLDQAPSTSLPTVISGLFDTGTQPAFDAADALQDASDRIRPEGGAADLTVLNVDAAEIVRNHRTVMNFEAADAHRDLLTAERIEMLQPKFRAGLEAGAMISATEAEDAAAVLTDAQRGFWDGLGGTDIILTLPAPDGAPLLDGTTGFQDWLTPWTVFGGPLLTLPWGLDALGRPRSVMLAGRPDQDVNLLRFARMLEGIAPHLPKPTLPTHAVE